MALDSPAPVADGEGQIGGRVEVGRWAAVVAVAQMTRDLLDDGAAGDDAVAVVDLGAGAGGEDLDGADLRDREEAADEPAAGVGGGIGEEVAAGDEEAAVARMKNDVDATRRETLSGFISPRGARVISAGGGGRGRNLRLAAATRPLAGPLGGGPLWTIEERGQAGQQLVLRAGAPRRRRARCWRSARASWTASFCSPMAWATAA